MKKAQNRNKILSAACSAALVLTTLPIAAIAAPTSSTNVQDSKVTITGLNPGDTVTAYLIADADIDAQNNLSYTFEANVPEAYNTVEKLTAITSDGNAFKQNSVMQNAAGAIAASIATGEGCTDAVASTEGSAELTLGSGYYLVRVSATSGESYVYQNMIIDVSPKALANGTYAAKDDQAVDVKKTEVTVKKGVGEDYAERTDLYTVGDKVPFRVSTAIPNYPADSLNATFVIGDAPTAGLKIDVDTIKVNGTPVADFKGCNFIGNENGYEITFDKEYILANPGASIEVTYGAQLTSDAFSRDADDVTGNTATVKFNPNPYDAMTVTPNSTTKVQTYGYVFPKVGQDGTSDKALEGAVFTLYDQDGNEVKDENGRALTSTSTIVNGKAYVYFEDLGAGTYTAKETTVPAGYLKAPDQKFTLNAEVCKHDNPATTDMVENNYLVSDDNVVDPSAPNLPVTGGAGTFAITAAGVVLVCGSLVLVARSRRREEN